MLRLESITKVYGEKKILNNVSFEINQGLNVIVGKSGSGKTTLLKIIAGIIEDYTGKVELDGENLLKLKKNRNSDLYFNCIGIVNQDNNLIPYLTVEQNILLAGVLNHLTKSEVEVRMNNLLDTVGMSGKKNAKVNKLSGGEKQRVSIVRALINNPKILIADEPTSALDSKNGAILMHLFSELSKERTVLLVTHDEQMIPQNANIYRLEDGKITSEQKKVDPLGDAPIKLYKKSLKEREVLYHSFNILKGKWYLFLAVFFLAFLGGILFFSGNSTEVTKKNNEAIDQLISKYGNGLYNISLISSFISAGNSNGDQNHQQSLTQDVSQVFDKYKNDKRLEGIYPLMPLSNLTITINGLTANYSIKGSNSMPVNSGLLAGKMPDNNKNQLLVPSSLLQKLNIRNKDVIGKNIQLNGAVQYENQSKEIKFKEVKIDGEISGVVNSHQETTGPNGEKTDYSLDDGFIYSKKLVDDIYNYAGKDTSKESIELRVKKLEYINPLVEELEKSGLTPIGQFENASNLSSLSDNTTKNTNATRSIIKYTGIVLVIIAILLFSIFQNKEARIIKSLGYDNRNLKKLLSSLILFWLIFSLVLTTVLYPCVIVVSKKFATDATSNFLIPLYAELLVLSIIIFATTLFVWKKTPLDNLIKGDD
ncbi:ABC transporter ATP-binding protein [Enterococcus faecalis]